MSEHHRHAILIQSPHFLCSLVTGPGLRPYERDAYSLSESTNTALSLDPPIFLYLSCLDIKAREVVIDRLTSPPPPPPNPAVVD
jgi:hypothetical protein